MTSFIIKAHENRPMPAKWQTDAGCIFCQIIRGEAAAHKVYENDWVVAILVIPKVHIPRVSELPDEFAGECGKAVSRVSRAIAGAVGNTALNVVCNQEYAQAVYHVHYHIIPAPRPGSSELLERGDHVTKPLTHGQMHRLEFEARTELEEKSAKRLTEDIRARL